MDASVKVKVHHYVRSHSHNIHTLVKPLGTSTVQRSALADSSHFRV